MRDTNGIGSGSRDKRHIQCFSCNKMGHYSLECRSKRSNNETHLTRSIDEEPALMLSATQQGYVPGRSSRKLCCSIRKSCCQKCSGNEEESEDVWYLDNGASNHMTGHHEKFQDLDETVTGRVRFGDRSTVQIMGRGTVVFTSKDGSQKAFQEVYYIPKLCSNIISLGQIAEDGNEVHMRGENMKVLNGNGKLLMLVKRTRNRLYKITLKTSKPIYLLSSLNDPTWLWHARLGYVNFHDLKLLGEKKMAV